MLFCCSGAKGGVGTSTVAVGVATLAADSGHDVVLVDLVGDLPAICAIDAEGPGVSDWVASTPEVGPDALDRLRVPVTDRISVVPVGRRGLTPDAGDVVGPALRQRRDLVVVDAGRIDGPGAGVAALAHSVLTIVRPCYPGLRRLSRANGPLGHIVVVDRVGSALGAIDVTSLGLPVATVVPDCPSIPRAVDSGLLVRRAPRKLSRALSPLLTELVPAAAPTP